MSVREDGYYDVELVGLEELMEKSALDDVFLLKDLQQRKLFLEGDICLLNVYDVVKHILQYNREDAGVKPEERKPILLYLTSNGGEIDAGFQLIDVIESSITPVYTINLGYQYSMAFLIGIAGHKRFATKNAKYLLHDGYSYVVNSSAKVRDQIEFQNQYEDRSKKYILSKTKITEEEYDKDYRMEWYMFADEAKAKGVVDYIIGEDCSIEAIV